MPSLPLDRRTFLLSAAATAVAAYAPSLSATPTSQGVPREVYLMDLRQSKAARVRTFPLKAVTLTGGFWGQRVAVNRSACIPAVLQQEVENGRMLNFQRLRGVDPETVSPDLHSLRHGADSEIYKWIEGASWDLLTPDRAAQGRVRQVVHDVISAQGRDGYLDTYFVGNRVPERMLPNTQIVGHEVYSLGHLLQAGIAFYRVTGDRTLLDAGLRFADQYLLATFGPTPKKPLMSGHPGPEMTFVELFRETGDPRYLSLAEYLLHGDERIPLRGDQTTYTFAGIPFTSRKTMEGHAVRAVYACCGAADYALETANPDYRRTLETLWDDMVERQMYITGSVGATEIGEAFGGDYRLPNDGSYCESCANIGVAQWAQRMLALTGEARFGDALERVLYNSVNSGMALDGRSFNYRNPLLYNPASDHKVRRPFWYVNCCPPNLARTFSSLQSLLYGSSPEGVYVHLYNDSELKTDLADLTPITLTQKTNYPWDGAVHFDVQPARPTEFTIFLRIPTWSTASSAKVNGVPVELVRPGTYLAIRRTWSSGDKVELTLDMTPRILVANPRIEADRGRIAIQRGPLVYCVEAQDQLLGISLDNLILTVNTARPTDIHSEFQPHTLGGVVILTTPGTLTDAASVQGEDTLYAAIGIPKPPDPVTVKLIPYYAFANREDTPMQVWMRYTES